MSGEAYSNVNWGKYIAKVKYYSAKLKNPKLENTIYSGNISHDEKLAMPAYRGNLTHCIMITLVAE